MARSGLSPASMPPPGKTQTGTSLRLMRRMEFPSWEKTAPATLLGIMASRIRNCFWICNIAFLLFASCYRNHLYVQQEWIDRDSLASVHIGTPDPRQKNPPEGQRLLIAWDFPRSLYQQGLTVWATVRFWDEKQESLFCPVDRKRGYTSFFFSKETS